MFRQVPRVPGFIRKGLTPQSLVFTFAGSASALSLYGGYQYKQTQEMRMEIINHFEQQGKSIPKAYDLTQLTEVQPHEMKDGQWQELKDDHRYTVRLALKPAFESHLGKRTLAHTSLAFQFEDQYLVIGRQSPSLSNTPSKDSKDPFHKTLMDNEKNYTMPALHSNFKLVNSSVTLTGAEIKAAISATQEKICEKELCDMARSNCCTAAVETICNMIKEVKKREDSQEKTDTLHALDELLYYASHVNFSQGISNNPTVRQSISEIIKTALAGKLEEEKPAISPSKK